MLPPAMNHITYAKSKAFETLKKDDQDKADKNDEIIIKLVFLTKKKKKITMPVRRPTVPH